MTLSSSWQNAFTTNLSNHCKMLKNAKHNIFIALCQMYICIFDDLSRSSSHLFPDNFVLVIGHWSSSSNDQHKVVREKVRRWAREITCSSNLYETESELPAIELPFLPHVCQLNSHFYRHFSENVLLCS